MYSETALRSPAGLPLPVYVLSIPSALLDKARRYQGQSRRGGRLPLRTRRRRRCISARNIARRIWRVPPPLGLAHATARQSRRSIPFVPVETGDAHFERVGRSISVPDRAC